MAYCEHCPVKNAWAKIDQYLENPLVTDANTRLVLDAFRTIFAMEAIDRSMRCRDGQPLVEKVEDDEKVEYVLVCSDDVLNGFVEYLSDTFYVGGNMLTEVELARQYPFLDPASGN